MKIDFSRYAPLGINLSLQKNVFISGMVLSLFSGLHFFTVYSDHLSNVWYRALDGQRYVYPGAMISDFINIWRWDTETGSGIGFLTMSLLMLIFVPYYYYYHYQGSHSIYLMRRLPSRWELHIRCWSLPLMSGAAFLLAGFVLLLFCFFIYMVVTPGECIPPGQWQKIWSVLL